MSYQDSSPDSRRYARFEIIECAIIYEKDRTEPYRAVVVDIGLGGVQLRSKEVLPVGEVCRIHVGRDGKKPFEMDGEVRYSHGLDNTDLIASGIRFVPSDHEQRIAVAEYVHGVFRRQGESLVG
jgi:hypothetical protein